jgi:hypothetical protein
MDGGYYLYHPYDPGARVSISFVLEPSFPSRVTGDCDPHGSNRPGGAGGTAKFYGRFKRMEKRRNKCSERS